MCFIPNGNGDSNELLIASINYLNDIMHTNIKLQSFKVYF